MAKTLSLDTSNSEQVTVILNIDGVTYEKSAHSRQWKSQMVLPLIETLLTEHNLTISDISALDVVTQNGSFTGLRVGASIANTLGILLGVPVNGKQDLAIPSY